MSTPSTIQPPLLSLYRSARIHAAGTIILLVISIIIITTTSMIVAYTEIGLIQRLESGTPLSEAVIKEHELRAGMVILAFALIQTITATIFIVWMYRVLKNVEGLGVNLEYSPKDAIIWWFVPLLWYYRPYQVMKEIWDGSHSENHHPHLLLVWWIIWIIGNTLYWFAYISGENTLSQLYWGNLMTIAASGINILAAILAITTVWQTTSAQERKYIRLKTA